MTHAASPDRIQPLADDAWLIELGDAIDDGTNVRAHALGATIRAANPRWLRDLVPAYASLGVFFDVQMVTAVEVRDWLLQKWASLPEDSRTETTTRIVDIPVLYGGDAGPDLASAAAELAL
ncbi:MAG: carboxyltransferase domain-containing protein, partial [Lysobacter sp.]